MSIYRLLVTGSREWTDALAIHRVLDDVIARVGPFVLVHGSHWQGADAIADRWGYANRRRGVVVQRFPAEWPRYGQAAGFIRNQQMVNEGADVCHAFIVDAPGKSVGTLDCAGRAEVVGIRVVRHVFVPAQSHPSLFDVEEQTQ